MADVPKVALTYYLPDQTDRVLDDILPAAIADQDGVEIVIGREGLTLTV